MKDLNGKVAFVTGAANGIGLAIVRSLLARGMRVAMADVQFTALTKAATGLNVPASRLHLVELDVRDPAAMAQAAASTVAAFGAVHVLCNNAGVGGLSPMLEASLDEWRWMLDVNLFGAIHGVQHFLPLLQAHGEGGHIVNTCSMASFLVPPPVVRSGGLYATTKFALRGYTEALRVALDGTGVDITGVYPAMVATALDRTTVANGPTHLIPPPPVNEGQPSLLHLLGISPDVVGERIAQAIEQGLPNVFTHSAEQPLLRAHFEQLLADFPAAV